MRFFPSGVVRDERNRILLRRSGETTELGEQHRFEDLDPWRQGVEIRGNREVATLRTGEQVTLARTVRGVRKITRRGQSYFKNRRVQWMINVPATKVVLQQNEDGPPAPRKSGTGNDRRWNSFYTILDKTLQTFYNGDLLDENSEAGRKQRDDVYEAAQVWVRGHDKDARGHYIVSDKD